MPTRLEHSIPPMSCDSIREDCDDKVISQGLWSDFVIPGLVRCEQFKLVGRGLLADDATGSLFEHGAGDGGLVPPSVGQLVPPPGDFWVGRRGQVVRVHMVGVYCHGHRLRGDPGTWTAGRAGQLQVAGAGRGPVKCGGDPMRNSVA